MADNQRGSRLWQSGKYFIAYRKDRAPGILVLYEAAVERDLQKCQVSVRHFGRTDTEEANHNMLQKKQNETEPKTPTYIYIYIYIYKYVYLIFSLVV